MRVLLADDEPTYRLLVQELLTDAGYDVVVADDGRKALEILNSDDPPRLAVLDWMMPRMDGIEVCRRIRERESDATPYLILLTGMDTEEAQVEGMNAGADAFIPKSLNIGELVAVVDAGKKAVELQNGIDCSSGILSDPRC